MVVILFSNFLFRLLIFDFLITKTVYLQNSMVSLHLSLPTKSKLLVFFILSVRFYGEPVIKACIENGISCIDISGEPQVCKMKREQN